MQILQEFSTNFIQILPNSNSLSRTPCNSRPFCSNFWTIFGIPTIVMLPLLASVRPWIAMYVCSSYSGQKHVLSLHTIRDAYLLPVNFGVSCLIKKLFFAFKYFSLNIMKRKLKYKSSKYVLPSNRTLDILKIGVGTHN